MNRIELVEDALQKSEALMQPNPAPGSFDYVATQLQYLLARIRNSRGRADAARKRTFSMKTWRSHMFEKGLLYRVKKGTVTATCAFVDGEVLEFVDSTYSPYASSSGFMFRNRESNELKTWFLHDDQADLSSELFELCKA